MALKADIPAAQQDADVNEVVVTVTIDSTKVEDGVSNEPGDISLNPGTSITVRFPTNTHETDVMEDIVRTATFSLQNTDEDAEDETVEFAIGVNGDGFTSAQDPDGNGDADGQEFTITIKDAQPQEYVLTLTSEDPTEAGGDGSIKVKLEAEPGHVDNMAMLTLHLDDPIYTIDGGLNVFTVGLENGTVDNDETLTITPPSNDKNRKTDTVTLKAFSGDPGDSKEEDSLEIKVADAHALPAVTVTAIVLDEDGDPVDPQPDMVESIEEGQMIDLKVTVVDKEGDADEAGEDLMVSLMPTGDANEQDYRLSRHPVTIAKGAESETIALTASANPDLGMEMLMFDADVAGVAANGTETRPSAGVLSLEIMDATERQVEAKLAEDLMPIIYGAIDEGDGDDNMFNPGETIELDASTLFKPTEYSITYSIDSDMMDVAKPDRTGNMVKVEALMAGGPADITITATATGMMSGAKPMPIPQTKPNVAQVIFSVTVVDTPLVVTVSTDPMEMVDEGGMVKVTATSTTRDILADEEAVVMLDVNGPATGPDSITIPAGMNYGSIDLMVNDDGCGSSSSTAQGASASGTARAT